VGHVEAKNIDARLHELRQLLASSAGRADRGHDFRAGASLRFTRGGKFSFFNAEVRSHRAASYSLLLGLFGSSSPGDDIVPVWVRKGNTNRHRLIPLVPMNHTLPRLAATAVLSNAFPARLIAPNFMANETDASETNIADSGSRVAPRTWLFVAASLAMAIAGVLLALKFFVAERLPELTEAAVETAMQRWDKSGPKSYDMNLELRGARPGVVHVEVRDGEITAETRDGRVPGQWTWGTWSVPGLFDTLLQDLQTAANPDPEVRAAAGSNWLMRCEFNPQFGYPQQYHRQATNGPEVFWRVTLFTPK
jgi:hypothetical protein